MKAILTKDIKSQGRISLHKGDKRTVLAQSANAVQVESSPGKFMMIGKDECRLSL